MPLKKKNSTKTDDVGDSLTETDEEFFTADDEGTCRKLVMNNTKRWYLMMKLSNLRSFL